MPSRNDATPRVDHLIPVIYEELKRAAHCALLSSNSQTLNTTALVNEAYLKLAGSAAHFEDERHAYAVAVRAMRQIIVDFARRRLSKKRSHQRADFDIESLSAAEEREVLDTLAIDEMLYELERAQPALAQVFELRYFGGYTIAETARIVGSSTRTVERRWLSARDFITGFLKRTTTPRCD